MSTESKNLITLNAEYLKKAGIEISLKADAAKAARAALVEHNRGRGYVPTNAASDTVIQIMDYARQELDAGENAMKHVCVALASVKLSKGYELAHDATGKPYTSMTAFAMDIMPTLAKSTVASYVSVGENVYVPAIAGKFGASSKTLLELPPSTLDAMKSNLTSDDTRNDTIAVLKVAAKGGKITQRLAKNIAKVVRDRASMEHAPGMTAGELLKAAQGDAVAQRKIYGAEAEKPSTARGATKNGGNAESAESKNADEYNAVKAAIKAYVTVKADEKNKSIDVPVTDVESFCGFLRKVMLASDDKAARYVCRALAEIIEK